VASHKGLWKKMDSGILSTNACKDYQRRRLGKPQTQIAGVLFLGMPLETSVFQNLTDGHGNRDQAVFNLAGKFFQFFADAFSGVK